MGGGGGVQADLFYLSDYITIKGYQWYGKNRNEKGGGVGFLMRNDITNKTED